MSSEKPKHGQDAHRDRGLAVKNTDLKAKLEVESNSFKKCRDDLASFFNNFWKLGIWIANLLNHFFLSRTLQRGQLKM